MTIVSILLIILFIAQGVYRNWNRKTFDAMPPHLDESQEWNGKDDDDHWYTSWRKAVKGWFAFGPLSEYSWARFRNYPITWFAIRGQGRFRFESDRPTGLETFQWSDTKYDMWFGPHLGFENYFSRVQYYTAWHLAFHWPLFISMHIGNWQGYIGFKRDADRIYWLSLYFGRKWK